MKYGDKVAYLNDLAENGSVPAALLERPELSSFLEDVVEAFWLLIHGCGMNGGGMTALHLEPPRIADMLSLADVFGFDPLYFVRVIQPAIGLYRVQMTDRLSRSSAAT